MPDAFALGLAERIAAEEAATGRASAEIPFDAPVPEDVDELDD
jgi:hypothetical protein